MQDPTFDQKDVANVAGAAAAMDFYVHAERIIVFRHHSASVLRHQLAVRSDAVKKSQPLVRLIFRALVY